jgi:hypothetical protein
MNYITSRNTQLICGDHDVVKARLSYKGRMVNALVLGADEGRD